MSTGDKRSRLAGFGTKMTPGLGRPQVELHITFAPGRDQPHWFVAVGFEKAQTVQEVADRLRGMATLIEQGEVAYGHPVLTVGGT